MMALKKKWLKHKWMENSGIPSQKPWTLFSPPPQKLLCNINFTVSKAHQSRLSWIHEIVYSNCAWECKRSKETIALLRDNFLKARQSTITD